MVALTLGLVIIGGVISIFLANQQAFRTTEGLNRLQENARISFELMARELRQAGGNPCGTRRVANVLWSGAGDWATNWAGGTIIGYDGNSPTPMVSPATPFGSGTAQRVSDTDAILVLGDALNIGPGITAHNATITPATITLNTANTAVGANTVVLICDIDSVVIAQVSSVTGNDTINFNATVPAPGTPETPGNCTTSFGFPGGCTTPVAKMFTNNGFVSPLSSGLWYIGNNGRAGQSLYRRGRLATEEIAEGVTNMQIEYLFRTRDATSNAVTLAADWVDAAPATNWTAAPGTPQAVALRIRLTLEASNAIGTNQAPIAREMVYVVNLRNRLE
jgi:type IV pilus assembly protein PilW